MFSFSKTFQFHSSEATFYTDDVFKEPPQWEIDDDKALSEHIETITRQFFDWYLSHVMIETKDTIYFNQDVLFLKDCVVHSVIGVNHIFMENSYIHKVKNSVVEKARNSLIYKLKSDSSVLYMENSHIMKR